MYALKMLRFFISCRDDKRFERIIGPECRRLFVDMEFFHEAPQRHAAYVKSFRCPASVVFVPDKKLKQCLFSNFIMFTKCFVVLNRLFTKRFIISLGLFTKRFIVDDRFIFIFYRVDYFYGSGKLRKGGPSL
jgi:hypothetical protein